MSKNKRTFTAEDRMSILQEAERNGFTETSRKFNISPTLLSRWKKNYLTTGSTAKKKPGPKAVNPELARLREENEKLRNIVTRQLLELEVKTELLKKTSHHTGRKLS